MLKRISKKYSVLALLILGVVIRFTIFYISPPTNSYDDHLAVIHEYSVKKERPLPFSCWECYQPPVYYIVSALTFNSTQFIGFSKDLSWKFVQLINPILSILFLFLVIKIFALFKIKFALKLLYLSFFVVLPREVFTSTMIGNDYLLVFFSVASLFYFYKFSLNGNRTIDYLWLCLFVLLGGLTKQHGLLLLLLPGVLVLSKLQKPNYSLVLVLTLISVLLTLEELWKYNHTGEFMVSNQHYFDYAKNQFPGNLNKVEFISFRIIDLYIEPFITNETAASFPTEIFARTFFDYEYRFFSPKYDVLKSFGRFSYVFGLIWLLFFTITTWFKVKRSKFNKENLLIKITPALIGVMFCLVPVIQTIRYPYFSSMKAMFLLPGIIFIIIAHVVYIKDFRIDSKLLKVLTILNISFGSIFICLVFLYTEESLSQLHGPLWLIP